MKRYFENTNYGSYPQNDDFNYLPIEYELRFFTKWPIYCLTNNIVEKLKISSIEQLVDNRIYESNPWNADFDDLPFYGDKGLITRWLIYPINDNIVFGLNNGSSVYV